MRAKVIVGLQGGTASREYGIRNSTSTTYPYSNSIPNRRTVYNWERRKYGTEYARDNMKRCGASISTAGARQLSMLAPNEFNTTTSEEGSVLQLFVMPHVTISPK